MQNHLSTHRALLFGMPNAPVKRFDLIGKHSAVDPVKLSETSKGCPLILVDKGQQTIKFVLAL